jgi:molybdenum cofactor biosynthesis enzyme MoaA
VGLMVVRFVVHSQDIKRKKKLHELMEQGQDNERDLKRAQRDAVSRTARLHMAEMLQVLKSAYSRECSNYNSINVIVGNKWCTCLFAGGFQTMGTGVDGLDAIGINQDVVITPALKVTATRSTMYLLL